MQVGFGNDRSTLGRHRGSWVKLLMRHCAGRILSWQVDLGAPQATLCKVPQAPLCSSDFEMAGQPWAAAGDHE